MAKKKQFHTHTHWNRNTRCIYGYGELNASSCTRSCTLLLCAPISAEAATTTTATTVRRCEVEKFLPEFLCMFLLISWSFLYIVQSTAAFWGYSEKFHGARSKFQCGSDDKKCASTRLQRRRINYKLSGWNDAIVVCGRKTTEDSWLGRTNALKFIGRPWI